MLGVQTIAHMKGREGGWEGRAGRNLAAEKANWCARPASVGCCMFKPKAPSYLISELPGYVTIGYIEPRTQQP